MFQVFVDEIDDDDDDDDAGEGDASNQPLKYCLRAVNPDTKIFSGYKLKGIILSFQKETKSYAASKNLASSVKSTFLR